MEIVLLGGIALVSVACLVHLWIRSDRRSVAARLGWSLFVFVPLIGPLLYGAMYEPLPPQADAERAPENADAITYGTTTHHS
jgi:Phospholipase_D-nuclease N-terminal